MQNQNFRKGVKWVDDFEDNQRARSLTPTPERRQPEMSHYGSLGSLYNRSSDPLYQRDLLYSPAYSTLDKSQDDSIRYETGSQGSRRSRRRGDSESKSKFSGYGDRPGSGVEFMPFEWRGGEIVYDARHLPKTVKPRRLYYSPIGDGVVAADGVEMKKQPKDMSPRITISHIHTVDRGEPGRPGYNLYEKHVTQGGSETLPNLEFAGHSPRSQSNISGNDLLERLSKQPSGKATPDSTRGGASANSNWPDSTRGGASANSNWPDSTRGGASAISNWPESEYSHRNPVDSWLDKKPYDKQDFGRNTRNFEPSNLLNSPGSRLDTRYGSAPPSGYSTYDNRPQPDRHGSQNRYDIQNQPGDRYDNDSRLDDRYGNNSRLSDRLDTTNCPGRFGVGNKPSEQLESVNQPGNRYDFNNQTGDRYGNNSSAGERYGSSYSANDGSNSRQGECGNQHDHYVFSEGLNTADYKGGYGRHRCTSESSGKHEVTKEYLITNPRELIHHYATTTPVAIFDGSTNNPTNLRNVEKRYMVETEERFAPYPPYKGTATTMHPNNFVRQLRDETLTDSQREANRYRDPFNAKDEETSRRIQEVCQSTKSKVSPKEIDYITEKLMNDLRTGHPTPSPL